VISFPDDLARAVSGYSFTPITGGCSPAEVFLLQKPGDANLYLKMAPRDEGSTLHDEKLRLEWLSDQLPVPQVRFYGHDRQREYLLMSEIPGIAASDKSHTDLPDLVHLLGVSKIEQVGSW